MLPKSNEVAKSPLDKSISLLTTFFLLGGTTGNGKASAGTSSNAASHVRKVINRSYEQAPFVVNRKALCRFSLAFRSGPQN